MIAALFCTGLLVDVLWCVAVQATALKRAVIAAGASFILAVVQMSLMVAVFASPAARSVAGIVAFSAGSAIGSYFIVRYRSDP